MTQFNVTFSTDNDAFADAPVAEIARILEEVAKEVRDHGHERVIRIRDINGARVGFATGLDAADVPELQ